MKLKLIIFSLLFCSVTYAQTKGTVKGKITDKEANNAPLPFANVSIKDSTIGVTTNEQGEYSLLVVPGDYILVLAMLDMKI